METGGYRIRTTTRSRQISTQIEFNVIVANARNPMPQIRMQTRQIESCAINRFFEFAIFADNVLLDEMEREFEMRIGVETANEISLFTLWTSEIRLEQTNECR